MRSSALSRGDVVGGCFAAEPGFNLLDVVLINVDRDTPLERQLKCYHLATRAAAEIDVAGAAFRDSAEAVLLRAIRDESNQAQIVGLVLADADAAARVWCAIEVVVAEDSDLDSVANEYSLMIRAAIARGAMAALLG